MWDQGLPSSILIIERLRRGLPIPNDHSRRATGHDFLPKHHGRAARLLRSVRGCSSLRNWQGPRSKADPYMELFDVFCLKGVFPKSSKMKPVSIETHDLAITHFGKP